MKKIVVLVCVVLLGSVFASAAATHYTVTLTDYCDIWSVTLDKGINAFTGGPIAGKVFVWGTHDELTNCGITTYDTIGEKHGASAAVPPNNIYGTSQAVLDVQDTENTPEPTEFLLRVTNGCGAAVYTGGTNYGGNIYFNEDTCSVGPVAQRKGLSPIAKR